MTGFIYIVETECGRVKIGYSRDPVGRVAAFATHSPLPCRLVAMWPGELKDEAELHRRFHASISHGEWFTASYEVREFVASVSGVGVHEVRPWDAVKIDPAEPRPTWVNRKRSNATRVLWRDPEYRANVSEAMRLHWKKRRAPAPEKGRAEA